VLLLLLLKPSNKLEHLHRLVKRLLLPRNYIVAATASETAAAAEEEPVEYYHAHSKLM
jgi:hypothetical protein